jgi:hypothetical protein
LQQWIGRRVDAEQSYFKLKVPGFLLGLLLQAILIDQCVALTRINDDMGGSLGEYLLIFAAIRDSGERVAIDGSCFSACTLVAAMIPKERVCITDRAALGFHGTWVNNSRGQRVISPYWTRFLYQMYPPNIRNWITRHGGLGARTIVLKGRELATFYSPCK